MRGLLSKLVLVAAFATPLTAIANTPIPDDSAAKEVSSFSTYGRLDGWQNLDSDSLIVWVTPGRAYLVDLSRPVVGLRFAQRIGMTSLAGRVSARFDDVIVDGWRYRIESIHQLDHAEVKALLSEARRNA